MLHDFRYALGRLVKPPSFSAVAILSLTLGIAELVATPPVVQVRIVSDVRRISVGVDGSDANSGSFEVDISADGRFISFGSCATNLIAGGGRACAPTSRGSHPLSQVYSYDRLARAITLESMGDTGATPERGAYYHAISDDGRFVAFRADGSNLIPGVGGWQIYVRDRALQRTLLVSRSPEVLGFNIDISGDGRFVSYSGLDPRLAPGTPHGGILTTDVASGLTTLDSIGPDGAEVDFPSDLAPSPLSVDGRYIAFEADRQIYIRDRVASRTTLESIGPSGVPLDSSSPAMSADGQLLAFIDDDNGFLYLRDRRQQRTTQVPTVSFARQPKLSADGRYVSFYTLFSDGFHSVVFDRMSDAIIDLGIGYETSAVAGGVVAFVSDRTYPNDRRPQRYTNVWLAAIEPLAAPTNLRYTLAGSFLTLTWTAPATLLPVSYVIQAGSQPGASDVAEFPTRNTATTLSATINPNTTYYIRVRATDGVLTSDPSNEITVGSANCLPPSTPGSLAATTVGRTVTLMWLPAAGAASYRLEVGSRPGGTDLLVQDLGSATTMTAAGVPPGTYFVKVRSTNSCGVSSPSNEVLVQVQ